MANLDIAPQEIDKQTTSPSAENEKRPEVVLSDERSFILMETLYLAVSVTNPLAVQSPISLRYEQHTVKYGLAYPGSLEMLLRWRKGKSFDMCIVNRIVRPHPGDRG